MAITRLPLPQNGSQMAFTPASSGSWTNSGGKRDRRRVELIQAALGLRAAEGRTIAHLPGFQIRRDALQPPGLRTLKPEQAVAHRRR